jgi:hypothetical protein
MTFDDEAISRAISHLINARKILRAYCQGRGSKRARKVGPGIGWSETTVWIDQGISTALDILQPGNESQ